jgi:hypothetical protein
MEFEFSHFNPEAIIHEQPTIKSVSFCFGFEFKTMKIHIKGSPVTPLTAIRTAKKWLSKPMTRKLWKKWVKNAEYAPHADDLDYWENKCRGDLLGNHTWLDGAAEDAEHNLELHTGS